MTIAGVPGTWDVWIGPNGTRPCISYVGTTDLKSFSFDLNLFIQDAVKNQPNTILSAWYLTNIFTGFEIWRGGLNVADHLVLRQGELEATASRGARRSLVRALRAVGRKAAQDHLQVRLRRVAVALEDRDLVGAAELQARGSRFRTRQSQVVSPAAQLPVPTLLNATLVTGSTAAVLPSQGTTSPDRGARRKRLARQVDRAPLLDGRDAVARRRAPWPGRRCARRRDR